MAPGLFTTMRANWKKSSFFLISTNTALWYVYDYTITNDVMKTNCRRAALLGDQKLKDPTAQQRHITVILNPVAGKRKSKKLYTKWVEPLLHLAGIKVSLIETESPNQAYNLMKIMSDCDGVALVGGDGTVHEALNGLLHREDNLRALKQFPIGIIPTGQFNSIARYIHQNIQYRNQKEFLIQATARLIDSCTQKHDVLKIVPLEVNDDDTETQPIYGLRDIRYGKYQDNFFKVSGYYFYQNNIKPYWLRFRRAFGGSGGGGKYYYSKPQIESISYTEPCIGCSKCFEKHKLQQFTKGAALSEVQENANRRWWSMLAPIPKSPNSGPSAEELKELELAKRDNSECDRWIKVGKINEITDFRACMMGDKKVRLSLGREGEYEPSDVLETQDVRLRLKAELDEEFKQTSQKEKLLSLERQSVEGGDAENNQTEQAKSESSSLEEQKKEEDAKTKFLIDGQPIQAHSVEINALSKVITVFTGAMKIVPDSISLANTTKPEI